jgi:hypothetical protein
VATRVAWNNPIHSCGASDTPYWVSICFEIVRDRLFPFSGSKEHGPHPALISDSTIPTYQVEPLRHRRVGGRDRIIHLVDECGNLERHFEHAGLADLNAFVESPMLSHEHTVGFVLIDLPAVGRMNLFYIDRVEIDLITMGAIDSIEGPSLGPKGRSRIATEDQCHGTVGESIGKSKHLALVSPLTRQEGKRKVRGRLTDAGL